MFQLGFVPSASLGGWDFRGFKWPWVFAWPTLRSPKRGKPSPASSGPSTKRAGVYDDGAFDPFTRATGIAFRGG